jgi:dihydrofolate synthase/folylpolyglutamate synthase
VPSINSFAQANKYLDRFHDYARTKYNLNNMYRLMDYLDNPQNKLRVVHVAGTSGKTSTAYYISALLTAAGQKTGLTVSPHINEINERVQINGQPIDEAAFCLALSDFLKLVEKSSIKPSWFELMVAFAYWYFAREKVCYAVVEVGLGGLKDGTNVVDRADKVCIITDIGFDHVKILGDTLAEIAAQKAGIIQPGNQIFSYQQSPEIMQVLKNAAAAQHASLHIVKEIKNPVAKVPDYQFRNGYLAYKVYDFLRKRDGLPKISEEKLQKLQSLTVPGRMDIRQTDGKALVLDGAHNAQKTAAMVQSFKKMYPRERPAILLGMKAGKDYEEVVSLLAPLAGRVITTGFELSQDVPLHSMKPEALAKAFKAAGVKKVSSIKDQKKAIKELLSGPEKVCLVTGSLYLLGQLRNNGLI